MLKRIAASWIGKVKARNVANLRLIAILVTVAVLAGLVLAVAPFETVSAAGPFTVNTVNDTHCTGFVAQGAPGCTAVTDSGGHISLRSALEEASTAGGTTTVNLPAGTYNLSLGDLVAGTQANTTISLQGAGSASTTINQTTAGRMVINTNYNVDSNVVINITGVTISGGSENENDPDGFGGNAGAILAGGSASATGDSLNVTDVVFSGNYCSPVSNAGCSGGAISMAGGGSLTVTGSTFSGNTASKNSGFGAGGAIYFDNGGNGGNVSITNSTFTNNVAQGNATTGGQGGAIRLSGGSGTTYTVNNNTFTGNAANGTAGAGANGGAITLISGSLTANFNRVVGNSSANGSGLFVANNSGTAAAAADNWWGCNGGPGAAGCDTAVLETGSNNATMAVNPWIVLKTTAGASPIDPGGTTTITASFLQDSAKTVLTAGDISTLIGLPVTWSATNGALSGQQTTIQSNGAATATFTNDGSCNTGSAEAQVDNVQTGDSTATAIVKVNCPDLTAAKSDSVKGSVVSPAGWTWTVHVANIGNAAANFAGGQTLLADNLPNSGLAYGSPSLANATGLTGTVACGINSTFDLACTASGAVQLAAAGSFDVNFTVTPSALGPFTNPRNSGSCGVDPNNSVNETDEGNNACNSDTVTVNAPPAITSANSTVFLVGTAGTFTITTTAGYPTTTAITESGALPSGVTFTDNGNGTATLAGTPGAGTGGTYPLTLTASNGILPNATQSFTLNVEEAPAITSANNTTFEVGSAGTFTVTTTGLPVPTITETGTLPGGVNFNDNGDGTATLSGKPAAGSGGVYSLTFTAHNGIGVDAVQTFTLNVNEAPAITSANSTTFQVGSAGTFTVTTTGFPAPALTESGALLPVVNFTDNGNGTATLAGTPAAGTGGVYGLTFTASNGVSPDATQSFTLTVNEAPTVGTQPVGQTVCAGTAATFMAAATGFPVPTVQWQVSTDNGATWNNVANATSTTLSITTTTASQNGNQYRAVFTNGVGSVNSNAATLTVNTAPQVTLNPVSQTVASGGTATFTAAASGSPAPTVQWQVSTDNGVTFTNLSGATNTTLSFTVTISENGYQYRAVFTGSCGTATTTAATLTTATATTTTVSSVSVQYSDPVTLTATVSPSSSGGQTISGNVQFLIGATSIGTVAVNSSGVAAVTINHVTLSAASYTITANFTSTNSLFLNSSGTGTLTVRQEDAFLQYTGDTIAQVGSNLNLRATAWDSAAAGFPGTNTGPSPDTTIGDITKMWVEFDIYPAGSCYSGTPATKFAQVADTGTTGDGIGTATTTFTSSSESSYCVVSRLVGGSSGGTNLFYAAPDAEPAGIDFYNNTGQFANGGGWINDPNGGHGNFGFNGRYNKNGQPQGQMVYVYRGLYNGVMADFVIKSNSLSGLKFSGASYPISATLQGKATISIIQESNGATLYSDGNATFSATVTDSGQTSGVGSDAFSLTVYDKNGVQYKTVSTSLLQGGNVIVHSK